MDNLTDELTEALSCARRVAAEAGAVLREGWGRAGAVSFKRGKNDLLTQFDAHSEALVIDRLQSAFPNDSIWAEESGRRGDKHARRCWIIDPLDGTTNFAHGLPIFSVSIGLAVAGLPAVGVVVAPALGWEFCAAVQAATGPEGEGVIASEVVAPARWNGQAIAPSQVETLERSLVVTGFPFDSGTNPKNNLARFAMFQKRTQGARRLGAASLDLCFVACGWLDGYWEAHLAPWDLCAGAVIALAAGAKITSMRGGPFRFESGDVLCSNGKVHDEMVALIGEPISSG